MPRIQAYVDDETFAILTKKAGEEKSSLSQVAGKAIAQGMSENDDNQKRFQIKTQSMLGHILSAVYDYETAKTNGPMVKKLLAHIDSTVEEKLKD